MNRNCYLGAMYHGLDCLTECPESRMACRMLRYEQVNVFVLYDRVEMIEAARAFLFGHLGSLSHEDTC